MRMILSKIENGNNDRNYQKEIKILEFKIQ